MEKKGTLGKLSAKEKFSWALGTGGNNIYTTIVSAYLTAYYTDSVGIAAAAIGTMMLISRVLDGVTDIAMGGIVDKTKSRWGKARPWILISAPLFAIGIILLMYVPKSWSETMQLIYAYVTYIFLNCFVNTAYFVAHNALLARMTLDPNERMKAASLSQIISAITTLGATAVINSLIQSLGWGAAAIALGIIIGITILIEFLGTKENIDIGEDHEVKVKTIPFKVALPTLLKNKYFFVLTITSIIVYIGNNSAASATFYYSNIILKDLNMITVMITCASVAMILINLVGSSLVKKFSKQKVAIAGVILNMMGFLTIGLFGNSLSMIIVSNLLRGVGVGIMFPCIIAFTADVVDYGEWKTGVRLEGMINSCISMGQKIGVGLGAAAVAWVISYGGYVGTAKEQSASAISAINFSFIWLSVIFCILTIVALLFMDIEKQKDVIEKDLLERHNIKEK